MQHSTRNVLVPGTVVYRMTVQAVRLARRYKRFLADCNFSEGPEVTTVHCPNTGPMIGLLDRPHAPALCSVASTAGRKYTNTLEAIQPEDGGPWVGIHSALANKLVEEVIQRGGLESEFGTLQALQREVKYGQDGKSRVDFLLTLQGRATQRAPSADAKAVVGRKRPGEALPNPWGKNSSGTQFGESRGQAGGSGSSSGRAGDGNSVNMFSSFRRGGDSNGSLPGGTRARMMYVEVKNVTLISRALDASAAAAAEVKPRKRKAKDGLQESVSTPGSTGGLAAPAGASASTPMSEQAERLAFFPDSVSERAHRHMEDLMGVVRDGHEVRLLKKS
ncbi:sugar fermentation stimulation protein-domain-containing protein [Dunaliella salina]|uniref:Sugar fermentation stimulation protein-domain-containing protein n=1 Tax=Dunaliella salina TaxID=3046 RepID=A0ABQ7G3U5_DUNSA|nr:sugar fermentation stimulation protein-domain-containing protein [Dunaliella salina]|eukprot:KAF5829276.1 sugar fermentation stimulation protein-domain-containing protein [Dunaliella salina]